VYNNNKQTKSWEELIPWENCPVCGGTGKKYPARYRRRSDMAQECSICLRWHKYKETETSDPNWAGRHKDIVKILSDCLLSLIDGEQKSLKRENAGMTAGRLNELFIASETGKYYFRQYQVLIRCLWANEPVPDGFAVKHYGDTAPKGDLIDAIL